MGRSEPIGRRLFDQPGLIGALDQARPREMLDIRIFEEKREPGDVSLDRLGRSSNEPAVVAFLTAKGVAAGTAYTKPKQFHGWVVIQAKHLAEPQRGPKFPVVASPQKPHEPEHEQHNPYHAHVCRPVGHEADAYTTALYLKQMFEERSKVLSVKPQPGGLIARLIERIRWIAWSWR